MGGKIDGIYRILRVQLETSLAPLDGSNTMPFGVASSAVAMPIRQARAVNLASIPA